MKKELSGLSVKESMLTDSYASQVLRKDLYEEKMRDIANQRVELEKQIEESQKKSWVSVTFEQIKDVFIDGSRAAEQYEKSKDEAKRVLLEKLLSNATIKNKTVAQYKFKSPYQLLADAPKNTSISTLYPHVESASPLVSPSLDSGWPPPRSSVLLYGTSLRRSIPLALLRNAVHINITEYPHVESNHDFELRRPALYPLSYGDSFGILCIVLVSCITNNSTS